MFRYSNPRSNRTYLNQSSAEGKVSNSSLFLNESVANEFNGAPHPVIIVPALLTPGNLALSNVKSFLEKGIYDET